MLTLDEMHECITTYLRDGGYEDGVWMPSVKYDTGASTRFPVYGITYSNTAVPMVPPSAKLEIAEGWTLCGGMEHGDREILPKIWLKDNNQTRFDSALPRPIKLYFRICLEITNFILCIVW